MNRFESQEPLSTFTENCEDVDEEIPWKYFAHSTWIVFDFVSSVFVALWNAWKSDWGNLNMQMKITMTTSVFFSTFDFLLNYNRNNKLILLGIENKKDENFQWKIAQIKEWNTKFRRQKWLSLKEMKKVTEKAEEWEIWNPIKFISLVIFPIHLVYCSRVSRIQGFSSEIFILLDNEICDSWDSRRASFISFVAQRNISIITTMNERGEDRRLQNLNYRRRGDEEHEEIQSKRK